MEEMKKPKIREVTVKKYIFVFAMLIIPLIHFAFFYFYINGSSFLISFQSPRYDGSGIVDWGFDNYKLFFDSLKQANSGIWEALLNTLTWFFVSNFVNLPLSLLICYFIFKRIRHYHFFRTVIYLPCIIMGTILVTIFKYMVGTGGPLFAFFDLIDKDYIYFFRTSEYAMKGMLFYTISMGLGGNFILLGGAMNAIGEDVIDAGKIDGAGPFRELLSIVIPAIWPTLGTMLLLSSTGILGASGPILLFTQGEFGTNTLSYWIYDMTIASGGSGANQEYAATVGMLMTVVTLPIVFTVKKLTGVTGED